MSLRFYFLVRSYKNFNFLLKNLSSILRIPNKNYTVLFVDDKSNFSLAQKKTLRRLLENHVCVFNSTRKYAVQNAYEMIHAYVAEHNAIIINLDGDDWLLHRDVLQILESEYSKGYDLTFGNCILYKPDDVVHGKPAQVLSPLLNKRYPKIVERQSSYRLEEFRPLHLRSWRADLFKKIPISEFKNANGEWFRFCEDQVIFYPLLEMSGGNYSSVATPLSVYNMANQLSDDKVHLKQKLLDEVEIRRRNPIFFGGK